MTDAVTKQFGEQLPGLDYRARDGAYGLLVRADGNLASVRIGYDNFSYDLPGGGVDPGETPEQAVVREFAEEVGLRVRVTGVVTDFLHYFIHEDGTPYNNHSHIFTVEQVAEAPDEKVEADHELVWLTPLQMITNLNKEGYAWAIVVWLRNRSK